jgi:hypothetical protein
MKSLQRNLFNYLLVVTTAASLHAETIYLSGGAATRTVNNKALVDLGFSYVAWNDTSVKLGTTYANSKNEILTNGTDTLVVSYQGSELGYQAAASGGSKTVNFIPTNTVGLYTNTPSVPHSVDIAFGDAEQSISRFYQYQAGDGVNYANINAQPTYVISYDWVASKNTPLTNVSALALQFLFVNGNAPLTLFTGNINHANTYIYATGRDIDAGQRIHALLSIFKGAKDPIQQYQVNSSNSIQLFPTNSIDGIYEPLGYGGLNASDTLVATLTNVLNPNLNVDGVLQSHDANYLISYSATSDANSQTNNGLIKLGLNGQFSSTNNIINGSYPIWSYAQVGYNPNSTARAKALAAQIVAKVRTYSTSQIAPNVSISDMNVDRNGSGGTIFNIGY